MNGQKSFPKGRYGLTTRVRCGVVAVAACFAVAPALSNPVNPVVVSGTAAFSQVGNVLTVTNSNGAIINWEKFSIKAGETTHFTQPSASSSVLNRVLNDPTAIYGTLSSNGRVWLINPAGILVGSGGRIDTAGFVASTLNVRNEDFLAGRKLFEKTPGAGNVVNQGEIRTPAGGSVYLIGSNVGNEGIIHTPEGETILAAGATVSLIDSATPGVKVEITGAEGKGTNLGEITAEAGRVGIAGVVVRNSGLINASSVVSEGGRVFLKASRDAYVDGNGRIVTTGTMGGSVEVLGERVAVADAASVDASGANGGGKILVGGDFQGKNPEVGNARISYIGTQARLTADATEVGAGGTVIVWADDITRVHGGISARGGANGGNGGFVETSGKRYLEVTGARVDTSAGNGLVGSWLLDPTDIAIHGGAGITTGIDMFGVPTAAAATIYAADININLATTDVMLSTASAYGGIGNITVLGDVGISNTSGLARTFGLEANGSINVQYGSVIAGSAGSPLSVMMKANGGNAVLAGTINTFGGNLAASARDGISLGDGVNTAVGTLGIIARRDGASGGTQGYDTAGYGGRILLDADSNRDGIGSFTMNHGAFIGTTSNAHLLDASGNIGAYGSAKVAVGIIAADVELASSATIKLNYDATASAGAPLGGGDIAFLPTTTGDIRLGNFSTQAPHFSLDNAELARIYLPANGAANCGTGQEGCRIWIGGVGVPNDPLVGALPATNRNIKLDHADFTLNGATTVPKRAHLTTSSTADINDLGDGGGYYGVKAGHLSLNGGGGVGGASGTDGVEFIANSVALNSSISGVRATSIGGGDLAIRSVTASGDVNLKAYYGAVTLLPYFSGQNETTPGNFNLTVDGNIRFASSGSSYTIVGPSSTFTETAAGTATIRAGASLSLTSLGGGVQLTGDQAAGAGLFIDANNDITIVDGGLASGMGMGLSSSGDLVLTGSNRGTIVKSGGMMSISAANLRAYGGSAINPGAIGGGTTVAFYGSGAQEDLSGHGAGVSIKSAMAQDIQVGSGEVWLQAGSASNAGGYGGNPYGGSVGIWSAASQVIQAGSIKLFGGATGHDNVAEIQAYGNQSITLYGGTLQMTGGGGTGGFNNQARIQHGQWTAGVGTGTGNQLILVYGGGAINLVGGSGTGTQGYYGSDCYAVLGEACRGGSNDSRIENVFGNQTLDFSPAGGQLNITGGSAGTKNSASLENETSATISQQIIGNPDIVLTGGSAGGGVLAYGGQSYDLSNDAGIYTKGTGSQSILANTVTIVGGAADVGGAGISNESGTNLLVQTAGNFTMTGGSSSSALPYGGAAYLANQYGGLISLMVGGVLSVTSGSGTSGPALLGSIDGPGNIQIYGGSVNFTANASFVAVGSKATGYGAQVTINSGGAISFLDSSSNPNGKILIGSDVDGLTSPTVVSINASGDITAGSTGGHGVSIGATTSSNAGSLVGLTAGANGYGGNLTLNASSAVAGYGGVTLAAINAYGGSGDITLSGSSVTSGATTGYVRIYGGRNVDLSGTVSSAATTMAAVDIQAGVTGPMAPTANLYGGDLDLHASTIQGYGGVSLFANNATGAQGKLMQTGGSIDAGNPGANVTIRTGGNATLVGPVTAGGGIDIQTGTNVVGVGNGYGGDLSIGGSLTANGGMGVSLLARHGSNANGDLMQTAGTIYGSTVMVNGLGDVSLNGSLTAGIGQLNVTAGDGMMMSYGGNLGIGSGALQGYGGVTLAATNATGSQGDITLTGGSVTSGGATGYVRIYGGRNVDLSGTVNASGGAGMADIQAGVNGTMAPTLNTYGGILALNESTVQGYGGITLAANNATGTTGDITQTGGLINAGGSGMGVTIRGGGDISLVGPVTAGGSIDIQTGTNIVAVSNGYGGDLSLGGSLTANGGMGANLLARRGSNANGDLTQTAGTIYGSSVTVHGQRNVSVSGSLTAGIGVLNVTAGDDMMMGYGGNLNLGSGTLQAYGGVTLTAMSADGSQGDIIRTGGSIANSGMGGIMIRAGRNANLTGSLSSTTNGIDVQTGVNGLAAMPNAYGGNLVLGVGTAMNAGGATILKAYGSVTGGGLTQSGSITSAGAVTMRGDRDVTVNGTVVSTGAGVDIWSGFNSMVPYYGGNLNFGAASSVAAYGGNLAAYSIGASESAGSILQAGGSLYSSFDVILAADGSVVSQGRIESPMNVNLLAGVDNYTALAGLTQTSAYGGNVVLGTGSVVQGAHVGLFANHGDFPDGTTGRVSQYASAGSLTATSTSLNVMAADNVSLLGAVIAGGVAPVLIRAGYDQPGSGPVAAFADKSVTVQNLASSNQDVSLYATGPILANLSNVGTLNAGVTNSSSGGIAISHQGATVPTTIALTDNATANSAINFQHAGSSMTLTASHSFSTLGSAGDILIAAPQNALTYNSAILGAGSVLLAGGSGLTIAGPLTTPASLGLSSGAALDINNFVQGGTVTLAAPTVNIVNGEVVATGDAMVFGSQINIGTGVKTTKLSGANVLLRGPAFGSGNLSLNGEVATGGQLEFNLANINGSYGGALYAHSPLSNITGFASGDITLNNGSYFEAGDDIRVTLTGPASTLSLLNGSYLLADSNSPPGSIYLDFTVRESGGLVIAGAGSGLFAGNTSTPAASIGALHIDYAPPAAGTTTVVVNELNRATDGADTTKPPTDDSAPPPPTGGTSGTGQPLTSVGGTTGGTEGTFGSDSGGSSTGGGTGTGEGGTGTSGSTGSGGTGSTNGEQSSTDTANAKDGADTKDDKQGGKDKDKDKDKDKKDQAKDEKKDEKPAQKKVAQCS